MTTGVTVVTGAVERFDYAALDLETRVVVQQRTGEIRSLVRRSAQDIIEIGIKLGEVKGRIGHGGFGRWLDAEFQWSQDTAGRFMQVAQRFGQIPQIADFAPTALYLLAAPSTPDEAVEEALERAEGGERITHATAKAIVEVHRPAAPAAAASSQASSEGRYASGLPVLDMPGGNGHASGVTSHASAVATENAESTEIDAWVAAWAVRPYDSLTDRCQRLAAAMLEWGRAWTDDKGRSWIDVIDRNPQHANSPFRQAAVAECKRRGVAVAEEGMAETIRRLFGLLVESDNLLLSDGEAEESTADFADFAEEEGETLTGDDLQVMQAFPAWVSAGADGDGAPGRETDEPQMSEYLAYRDRAQQNGDAYLNHRDWCTWVKAGRPVVTAKLLAAGDEVTADDAEDTAGAEDAGTAAEGEAGREGEGEQAPVSQREGYDSDEWYTPGWVIEAARRVMGEIDLDPASCELAQEVVGAGLYWSKRQDGCRAAWWGRVWLNPPYSAPGGFVEKLIEEYTHGNVKQAVVLLNNSTETRWFQRLLMRFPVCFFNQRLAFWRHDHADVGARQGQAVFYLGPEVDRFVSEFGEFGIVVRRVD